jgi:DNA packaging protein, QLRG family|nr:MAG TPA: head tail connector [Caudoviricetes sp.]
MVTLDEVKNYLRVDTKDDDHLLSTLILTSEQLCRDILRIEEANEFSETSTVMKIAILYSVAYLYEHREEANHKELTLTLRALLFGARKADF